MNQQRSRRFRAAQEATEKAAMEAKLAAENPQLAIQKPKEKFDSNCITPGTMFMKKVSESLAYYVADRQSKDKAWANVRTAASLCLSTGSLRLCMAPPSTRSASRLASLPAGHVPLALVSLAHFRWHAMRYSYSSPCR